MRMRAALCLAPLLWSAAATAQDRPLVIPQAEGEKHGKILGRALACGVPRERVDATIAAGRTRMQAALGRALTDERYVPSLDDAMRLETSLPPPSPTACEKGLAAFERLEKTAP
ncbi:hypothetical protein HNR00_002265 [Methylorubrum rhodinum]|uniref:Uncharacterized protein n=1 Tax=Methylorubrum rhodinum TaxID=29428 RepID=A0A840ZHQ4_9HYPH|nr:hypothetical protein [Methylorubrum rhodinum]MBB5757552.1 hypothetical protein [Methylorubrum rhodinum]